MKEEMRENLEGARCGTQRELEGHVRGARRDGEWMDEQWGDASKRYG